MTCCDGHPGTMIRDDLAAAGLTISDAARMMRVNRSNLTFVLNGGASVMHDLACRLSVLLYPDDPTYAYAKRLLAMQADYHWNAAADKRASIAVAMSVAAKYTHEQQSQRQLCSQVPE